MSRVLARLGLAIAAMAMVLAFAPGTASAQDDRPAYPGPFGADAEDAAAQIGEDADGDGVADGSVDDGSSIDANPSGAGIMFVLPDAQPNEAGDTGTTGGTGGGDSSTSLAMTGGDVEPFVAMAAGLLGVGGSVLVMGRRRMQKRG